MTTRVRRMRASEATEVADLVRQVIETLPYYVPAAIEDELALHTPERLATLVVEDPDAVLVAELDRDLAGFVVSRKDSGTIWLAWFGVAAAFRGQHVGAALLRALERTLPERGAHKVWCDSRTDNLPSAVVLERAGYRRVARLDRHWHGQDYLLWERFPEPDSASGA